VAEPILYPNPNSSLKKIFTIPVSPFLPLSLTWLMPLPPMQDYPCLTERPDKSRRRAVRREGRRRAGAWLWRPRGERRGRLAPALVLHPAQLRRSRTAPVPPHHRTHQLPREISSSSPQVIHSASLRFLPGKNRATSTANPPGATPTVSFFSLSCLYLILCSLTFLNFFLVLTCPFPLIFVSLWGGCVIRQMDLRLDFLVASVSWN
jgi:hypothetical protein